ncbi:MAG TPA: carbamoyltransferase HypF [Noviherbaspirillum sp.]|uniref:Kae1-like domain-containing protein n=1 Tax=Noviherbaspirillum sp. TaxID=1926288 RepID=UPI002B4A72CD|nr:carbamoyltransferase HypF [Noviherbaspirillum sp.]HJV86651.1 carbamoyltransferase HypF [Noviherbaspirillum sp.]
MARLDRRRTTHDGERVMTAPSLDLPAAASNAAVLACGAWLKNAACLLNGQHVQWSPVHGDLGDPANCIALEQSVEALLQKAGGQVDAIAHDLHPDFFSSQLALRIADQLGVPAIGVQHHHAHIGAVAAEFGLHEPLIGLALDGVGLGTDGVAWGGELLWVDGAQWRRLGHLQTLALPGGDTAAREPWRMAAAVLHGMGRDAEIVARYGDKVGKPAAQTVQSMLARGLNCPPATGAGRWFDAAAGALGISVKQAFEAEAAIALERLATAWLAEHGEPDGARDYAIDDEGVLDLRPLFARLFALGEGDARDVARGAALFHTTLVAALAEWTEHAAKRYDAGAIAFGGGCFFNRVLTSRLGAELERRDLHVFLPQKVSCGDAGLALGQAWVAAHQLQETETSKTGANACA